MNQIFLAEIKGHDTEERTLEAAISTDAVDRVGDVIRQDGWDLTHYLKNPVVLFGHDYSKPPIGRALSLTVGEGALIAKMQFADTRFAREIHKLYAEGYMRAFSVGFAPLEPPQIRRDDKDRFVGYEYTKQELLEFSAVPVPANPEALQLAMRKGLIVESRSSFCRALDEEGDLDFVKVAIAVEFAKARLNPNLRP